MAVIDELMNSAHKIETDFMKYMHHTILCIVQSVITCSKCKLYTTSQPKCLTRMKPGYWKRGKIVLVILGQNQRGEVGKGVP